MVDTWLIDQQIYHLLMSCIIQRFLGGFHENDEILNDDEKIDHGFD